MATSYNDITKQLKLFIIPFLCLFFINIVNASSKPENSDCKKNNYQHEKSHCKKHNTKKGLDLVIVSTERREIIATNSTTPVSGIVASKSNDSISNNGTIMVKRTSSLNSGTSKSINPVYHDNDNHEYSEDEHENEREHYATVPKYNPVFISTIPADTTGIATLKGDDSVINNGRLDVSSDTTLSNETGTARAIVIGIETGSGDDVIINNGVITVTSTANVFINNLIFDFIDIGIPVDISNNSVAVATGLSGGSGDDTISNSGTINANSKTDSNVVNVKLAAITLSNGSTAVSSQALAFGIHSGEGDDTITNSGIMAVESTANSSSTKVDISLVNLSVISDVIQPADDSSVSSEAFSSGIVAGAGDDVIRNTGVLEVTSNANTLNIDFLWSANFLTNPASIITFPDLFQQPILESGTTATANTIGINSGAGHDSIYNSGMLKSIANANVKAFRVRVDFPSSKLKVPKMAFIPSVFAANVATASSATAIGIYSGEGHDVITNIGTVSTDVDSVAKSHSINFSLKRPKKTDPDNPTKFDLSLGAALVDVTAQADATASAIVTAAGHDSVTNSGAVITDVFADADANNVEVKLEGSDTTITVNAALAKAQTEGRAIATGISTGSGYDKILNNGKIETMSKADTDSNVVIVDGKILTDTKLTLGAKLIKANTLANTDSVGVNAGSGNDVIINNDNITTKAESFADAISVLTTIRTQPKQLNVSIIGEGGWIQSDTLANANADGIVGGSGKDTILNTGVIDSYAFVDPDSVGVKAIGVGTPKGAAIGVGLIQAKTQGTASSSGISGGADKDLIINSGTVKSKAKSDVDATNVSATLTLAETGVALSGSVIIGTTNADSRAIGISGDAGNDFIKNTGVLTSDSNADSRSNGVSVTFNGAVNGVSVGVALARATTESHSQSSGLNGGSGNDKIINQEQLITTANSDSQSVAVSVAAGATGQGLTIEGSAVDASAISTATTIGIDGGRGKNTIYNSAIIDATADGFTRSTGVAVSISGTATGVPLGIALSRSTTDATANSTGIRLGLQKKRHHKPHHEDDDENEHSESFNREKDHDKENNKKNKHHNRKSKYSYYSDDDEERDEDEHHQSESILVNSGKINSKAIANSKVVGVSVTAELAGVGLAAGVAAVQTGVEASANATGLAGSYGNDIIINKGVINATSDADAVGTSVAVALNVAIGGVALGATFTDASTNAIANSNGIESGAGHDKISNQADINSKANADATSASISVNSSLAYVPGGAAFADLTATATTTANAINGGAGNDIITSVETLDSKATSVSNGTSVAVNIGLGVAFGDAAVVAKSSANGIDGGLGNDEILHQGSIITKSKSTSNGTTVSVNLVGASFADVSNTAQSDSVGINGNDGNDWINNTGTLDLQSNTIARDSAVTVTVIGASFSDSSTNSISNATGIAGGTGNDRIQNNNQITAKTDAYSKASSVTVTPVGAALSDASTSSVAFTTGISGDAGKDTIVNSGNITLNSKAKTDATAVSVTVAGAALNDLSLVADANAIGIDGGSENDAIVNRAEVIVGSNATASTRGTSVAILGVASVNSELSANSRASGLVGATGNDWLRNEKIVTVTSTSFMNLKNSSIAIAGSAKAGGSIFGDSLSLGLSGGEGNDRLENLGSVTAKSNVTMTLDSGTFNLAGYSATKGNLTAKAKSVGISAGAGNDSVYNNGQITANTTATLNALGGSRVVFGKSVSDAASSADAIAIGIDSISGDDIIKNDNSITVNATATTDTKNNSYTFAGKSKVKSVLRAKSDSFGINAGTGANQIINNGSVTVRSSSTLFAKGGARATFGDGEANATATAQATSSGITVADNVSGGGTNHINEILNTGTLDVNANSNATASNSTEGGLFIAKSKTKSKASIKNNAYGIKTGSGNNRVRNEGTIRATITGKAFAEGSANGEKVPLVNGDASVTATAKVEESEAVAIDTALGNNTIVNTGNIEVKAQPYARAIIDKADGDGVDGDGTAIAFAQADSITAIGIRSGNGNNLIRNDGVINVKSLPNTKSTAIADADESGDMKSTSKAYANKSIAYGITVGGGNNEILNTGEITVFVRPISNRAFSDTDGGIALINVDGESKSYAYVNKARAIGINAGHGNNWIKNTGTINVTSKPKAISFSDSDGDGADGDGSAYAWSKANNALAFGIWVGHGQNTIINDGTINATSKPYAKSGAKVDADAGGTAKARARSYANNAQAVGIRTGNGNNTVINNGTINVVAHPEAYANAETTVVKRARYAQAIGIWTGSGDDVIVNKGIITASATGYQSKQQAIRTGSGNDRVSLMFKSSVVGDIDLGQGDDTLHVFDAAKLTGDVNGGSGNDSIVFDGIGTFSSELIDFQNATKQGSGMYTLSQLAPMEKINVLDGTLRVDGDYQFNVDGEFIPAVATGQSGTFEVTGTVTLAGDINVIRGRGHYMDGDHYDILKASGGFLENSTFDDVIVPKKAPLLKFEYIKNKDTLQIKTDVEAFTTVATTKNEQAIASYLDSVLEGAQGDVSVVLGEIQALEMSEHSAAFSKLSPENYTQLSQVAVTSVHRYNTNLLQRMRVIRENRLFNNEFQYNPYSVRFNDNNGYMRTQPDEFRTLFNQVQDTTNTNNGFWLKGLRQSGSIDNSAQLSTLGFNQSGQSFGFDSSVSHNWVVGGSYGFVGSVMDFEADNVGDIESSLYSLYSSYFTTSSYFDWTFIQGNHDYLNQRNYSIGLVDVSANSAYTANVLSTSITSGYYIPLQNKRVELYSSLQYLQQNENGISESGGAGIAIAPYEIQSLQSQFGVRLGQHFSQHSYRFYTEVALGWLHEFDLGNNSINTSFASLSGKGFTIEQQQLAQDGLLLSTGLIISNKKQLQTVLDYNAEIRQNYSSQSIMGSVRYNF